MINIESDFATGNGAHSSGYDIWVDNVKLPNTYFCNTDNNFLIQSSTRSSAKFTSMLDWAVL
ncbi:MAG: hypothetical protein IPO65_20940 [Saprospiraceae bacterium]|nr:hypothetical protein [Saprospiraceae bacterium]